MKVIVKTWHRDSHGLFDFESSTLRRQYLESKGSCKTSKFEIRIVVVLRDQNDNGFLELPKSAKANANEALLSIIYSQGKYFAYHTSDIDLKLNEKWDSSNKEEMTPTLKELCKKAY